MTKSKKPEETPNDSSSLKLGEPHPSAHNAFAYVKQQIITRPMVMEAIFSTALSGNRTAEIAAGTLRRIMDGQPVSDRYVLGLAWFLLEMENAGTD